MPPLVWFKWRARSSLVQFCFLVRGEASVRGAQTLMQVSHLRLTEWGNTPSRHLSTEKYTSEIVPGLGTWRADLRSIWSISTAYPLVQGANMRVFLLKLLQLGRGVTVYPSPVFLSLGPSDTATFEDHFEGTKTVQPRTQVVTTTTNPTIRVHRNQTQSEGPMEVKILQTISLVGTERWVGHSALSSVLVWHLLQGTHFSGSSGTGQQQLWGFGHRDIASAFPCRFPGLYSTVKWYADSISIQRVIQSLDSSKLKSHHRAWWSVCTTKTHPQR